MSSHKEEAWTVDLNSSSGFQGKGGGGAHITSQGIVYASRFNVMSTRHRPCRSQLREDDLLKIAQAVSSTKDFAMEVPLRSRWGQWLLRSLSLDAAVVSARA
jgi:hypothetical protein